MQLLYRTARLLFGGLLAALALAGPARAQTCFFADDYSNPALWTQLGTGISVGSGGVQVANTSGGSVPSAQRGAFRPLPQPLPDGGGWRLELTMSYGNVGVSGGLLVVAVAAGNQHPLNIFPGGGQIITPQDCIGIITTGSLGARPVPLSLFVSDNGVWSQSAPLTLRLNAVTYLRLERLSTGLLKLSAFEDAARTIHQSGSPVCYLPPGQYTNLSTVWHANLPQGSNLRNDQATLDDLCLSTVPVLDTTFAATVSRTRICLGESLTLSASNAEYAPVAWATTTPTGATWTGSGPGVTYTPPEAGTYVFTASGTLPRFCNRVRQQQFTVEVVPQDLAALRYAQATFCRADTATVDSFTPAGGTFSGTPGLVVNATTGVLNLTASAPGAHTVTYTSAGFCPGTATFPLTVTPLDVTSVAYARAVFCRTGTTAAPTAAPAGGTFTATPGLVLDAATGIIDLAASAPGTHTITYTSAGRCPTAATFAVTVNALDVAAVSYAQAAYCQTLGSTTAPAVSPAGGTFSGTVGLVVDPATGVVNLAASAVGRHLVTYTSAGFCPSSATFPLQINAVDVAALAYPSSLLCQLTGQTATPGFSPTGGRFRAASGLVIDSTTGVVNAVASVAGVYTVIYTSAGPCPDAAAFNLTISPQDVAAIILPDSVYCQAGTTPRPTVLPAGGIFSGSAGLVFDAQTGVVDLARTPVGRYWLAYATTGLCPTSAQVGLRIRPRAAAAVAYADTTFCPSGAAPAPAVQPRGAGIFTGSAGLIVDERTGVIDLVASAPGAHTVTFTAADRCFDPAAARVFIGAQLEPVFYNVITPNGDGLNDSFGLPEPLPTVSDYELTVFSRWGRQVYRSASPAARWTGADVAAGSYFYHFRFRNCAGRPLRYKGVVEVVK